MCREFIVEVSIRKGLGPEMVTKSIPVGLDDLPDDITEQEVTYMAIREAEDYLRRSEDYPLYGENWTVENIFEA